MHKHSWLAITTALCLGLCLLSARALAQSATPTDAEKAKAQEHYKRGAAHHDRGELAAAIEEYEAAHALYPDPEFYFLIAEAYEGKGDKAKAVEYYGKYLAAAPNGRVAAKARAATARLQREIDAAKPEPKPPAEPSPEPTREKTADDADPNEMEGEATAAQIERRPAGKPGGGLRIGGLVTAGLGALAIGLGAKFGLDAKAASDDVEEKWDEDRYNEGEAAERNMFIMYGVGAAAVVCGGTLYFLGARKGKRAASEQRITVVPGYAGTATAVFVRGTF